MTIARDLSIAIIGAGLGGLTAALALQRAGFRPRVYEQAGTLGDVGAGISVTPNATKGLEFLGLGAPLAAAAQMPPQQIVRDGMSGAQLLCIDRSDVQQRYGAAYYMLHRAELHAMLVAAVTANDPDAIKTAHPLTAISVDTGARLTFSGQPPVDCAIAIAADGARSLVRTAIFGDQGARFTGHIAWRLLVPAAAAPDEARLPGSVVWAGAERSFVRYPVRGGTLINCVGLTRSGGWAGEGWSQSVPVAEMAAEFAGWVPDVTELIAAAPGGMVGRWGLFLRPPPTAMVAGPVALLGDAAHPMLPFMGQGAAMAIEDGVVLGRCFAAAATPADALACYQAARLERCRFIQAESAAGADRLQRSDGDTKRLDRNEDSLGIFAYDPATVPV
ncbi:MAG: FAD-dependent monooxygenase [Polymorphobacter sp.]